MDDWSARDDIPYHLRTAPRSRSWILWLLGLLLLAVSAGAYFYLEQVSGGREPPELAVPAAPPEPAAPPPQASAEPAIRHPIEPPAQPPRPLPKLEESDPVMSADLANLMGRKSFAELVYPEHLVRRIVATVDNLPRRTAPGRIMPFQPVAGAVVLEQRGDKLFLGAKNAARYGAFVKAVEAAHVPTFVRLYVERYPLFQRAYEELGYPGKYFNDRLVEAIDDLLAAPEPARSPELIRPKTLYEFADPDLETRSAGQKIMIRMGAINAAKVKAKLREVRRELAARAPTPG